MSTPDNGNPTTRYAPGPTPKTFRELANKHTISHVQNLEDQTCPICSEQYLSGPNSEFAVKLPACGHVFGLGCIEHWLEESNNTCPMCRQKILDITPTPELLFGVILGLNGLFHGIIMTLDPDTADQYEQASPAVRQGLEGIALIAERYVDAEIDLTEMLMDLTVPVLRHPANPDGPAPNTPVSTSVSFDSAVTPLARNPGEHADHNGPAGTNDNVDAAIEAINLIHDIVRNYIDAHSALSLEPREALDIVNELSRSCNELDTRFIETIANAGESSAFQTSEEALVTLFSLLQTHLATDLATDRRITTAIMRRRHQDSTNVGKPAVNHPRNYNQSSRLHANKSRDAVLARMHSSLVRAQNVFGFFTTVAFCTAVLTALSVLVIPQHPGANIELRNVQVVKGRPHYYSPKREEYAIIKFDLEADFTSLFNWNTKQLFVWITATYPSSNSSIHAPPSEAVIWDQIINSEAQNNPFNPLQRIKDFYSPPKKPNKSKSKKPTGAKKVEAAVEPGIIKLKNVKPKYQITDISGKLAERGNVTLQVGWNVQPWVGALTWTMPEGFELGRWRGVNGGKSKVFDMPSLKGKSTTSETVVASGGTPKAAEASAVI